ncbi:hypothetical protein WJX74_009528 [Apatococcus lobatus]|uniref:Autophagy-related protein 3 n=1 Tax=Apatococcus lobatus TaxID=904363 RepID=A0AAW1PRK2_9CHLO
MAFGAFKHALHSNFVKAYEAVTPHQSESNFKTTGKITNTEFEIAGDYLTRNCQSWTWEGGDHTKEKQFLPRDKQFLVTRGVPSLRRAATLEDYSAADDMLKSDLSKEDEGWVATKATGYAGKSRSTRDDADIPDLSGSGLHHRGAKAKPIEDDIPDMNDLALQDEAADEATAPDTPRLRSTETTSDLVKTRTYDLFITYDKYYSVPKFWLIGFDEDRQPLTTEQILKDVSEEHAKKTITVDPFPHGNFTAASIHPCKHSAVMKKMISMAAGSATSKELIVDHYLVLFLKFIASVIPTIEYDYTMASVV